MLERKQFGQPLAKFQAIQHQLAVMATEVAASTRSVDQMQMTEDAPSDLDVAIAKARVGEAVGVSTDTAHQVMGAMGYTREHHLNYLTAGFGCGEISSATNPFGSLKLASTSCLPTKPICGRKSPIYPRRGQIYS